ncbi:unnamed protein product [Sphenostylis stenocarpa]|uniref:Proliferating cell nuclear antigen PCNA C-terminal domain-containing protein n=1 Tax=Sphenostylis stenocarpa TaxID=92480 RepID=A0AA86W034_9FABA|nr:unnamed protein product [Sphenostylis stenocarpa]
MLKVSLVQGSALKKVIEVLRSVAREGEGVNFVFSSRGLSLLAGNPSERVMIFDFSLDDDMVTIEALHAVDYVKFIFQRQNQVYEIRMKKMSMDPDYQLHILEAEYRAIIETETPAILKMPSTVFLRFCSELTSIGDTVTIKIIEGAAEFSSKGELGTSIIVCREQNFDVNKTDGFMSCIQPEEAIFIEMNETASLTFSLMLMNSFTTAAPFTDTITVNILKDMPSMVEYKIGEMGYARLYLG